MKVTSALLTATITVGMISAACSQTSSPPDGAGGGSSKAGASAGGAANGNGGGVATGGGTGASCTSVTPCGGDVVGTWNVTSSCLKVSGTLDVRSLFSFSCATGQVSGSLQLTGSWSAKADGTFVDGTSTTGTEQVTLGADCLVLSGAPVSCDALGGVMSGVYFDTVTCTPAAAGGCSCNANVKQKGSMGILSADPQKEGNYTLSGNTLKIVQDNSSYAYCSSGKLTVTPQGMNPTTTGEIVLEKAGTGSGGSSGMGSGGASTGGSTSGGSSSGGSTSGGSSSGGSSSGGSSTAGMPGTGGGGSTNRGQGPCDIYAGASTPCGAAYSMVRALSSKYAGFLYQVRNMSSSTNTGTGGMTQDIGMTADGYADSAAQDKFCMGSTCTVSKIYDQSGNGNDLVRGSAGPTGNGTRSGENDYESTATKLSITAGGHKVYALYMAQYEGYRTALNVTGKGLATGNKDQGIYELVDGTHFGTACCWDFGSVSPDPNKYVTMNTVFFGKGFWGSGAGSAPWFMGDFEGGVWAGGTSATPGNNTMNPSMSGVDFALGILHTPVGKYALRMANLATATDLTTAYDGAIVSGKTWGNAGGITLGVGGDNSNNSWGTFFEGAVTNGSPTNATDLAVMKNIQAVGYKK